MPYAKIARQLRRFAGLEEVLTVQLLRGLVAYIADQIRRGERVRIPGLGVFCPRYLSPKTVCSNLPGQKGRRYRIPTRISVHLQPCESFKRELSEYTPSEIKQDQRLGDVVI
ncbi:MAG: hypothetical protein E3J72_14350 [Planctomycetota bacterium]|nr:MAG: hypothetical protein E3J72_14350 [Planctomycetota bacterium]